MATEVQDQKDNKDLDSVSLLLQDDDVETELQDDKSDKSDKSDVSDKDNSDDKSEKDEKLSLSESDDEGSDDLTYTSLPPVREIKEKFPEFFKKYPNIEKTLRREAHYAEVFPTIQEARDAAESVRTLNEIQSDLNSGSINSVLSELKRDNSKAFDKIADEFLDTVRSLDKDAFNRITSDNVSTILKSAYGRFKDSAEDSDNRQIAIAAKILYNYIFEGKAPTERPERSNEKTDKEKEFEQRQQQYESRRFNDTVNEINTRVKSVVQREIEKTIDPREQMSGYVKSKAVQECIDNLVEEISSDTRFNKLLENAYGESRREDYSEKSKSKIRKMLLNRAETLLPSIMKRVKDIALKGTGRKEKSDEKPLPRGKAVTNNQKGSDKKDQKGQIPAGMSSVDFLMSED